MPAMPADCSISAASASVTSSSRLSRARPVRKSTALATSTALPAAEASGSFMPVTSAVVFRPAPLATSTRLVASSLASRDFAMKAPLPTLTSSTSELQAGGELLRQDRGGDQRHGFDRRGDVADRIEALVGRRQIGGLADDGAAGCEHHLAKQRIVGLADIAGDRIHLVERAAGVAEAAARDHRHIGAAGCDDRRQHQRDIVADAAGRMLVGDRTGQIRPVEHVAGIAHGQRQRDRLVAAHAVEEDRHARGRRPGLRRPCRERRRR